MSTKEKSLCNVFENHGQDSRFRPLDKICQTVSATWGMGGNNQPLVVADREIKCYGICSYDSNSMKSSNPHSGIYEAETTRTLDNNGGNPACNQGGMIIVEPLLLESNQNHATIQTDGISTSLPASMGMGGGYVPMIVLEGNGQRDSHKGDGYKETEVMYTLNTVEQHAVAYRKQAHPRNASEGQGYEPTDTNDTLNCMDNGESRTPTIILENHPNDSRVKLSKDNKVQTLSGRMGTGGGNTPMALEQRDMIVRRLTPLECERLQGFPDGWTDIGDWYDSKGKLHKGDADSPRYKALGNSIALPFWQWMAERMVKYLDEEPTMASLFDGIGGFPLVYSRFGCEPIWASEIEEFPIAVTKKRIGDD